MEDKKKLFVANVSADTSEEELKEQFSYFGRVLFLKIVRHKRIAFVKMSDPAEARTAILGLNGVELHGCRIWVDEALPSRKNRVQG